jgi:hypothetical protein
MGDQLRTYSYSMTHRDREVKLACTAPPEQLLEALSGFAELLGFQFSELPIVMYVRTSEGGMWQPIHGTTETVPSLFPLPPGNVFVLKEDDYYRIGHKVLDSYVVMHRWVSRLHASQRVHEETKVLLDDLEGKMSEIENVVYGTDMERLFRLKYQQEEKNYVAAQELYLSQRTFNRKVRELVIHVGWILHSTLTPRRLQEIMQIADVNVRNIS